MPKTIANVPESITREAYLALIAGAGFDIDYTRSLEFRSEGIYATVSDINGEGREHIVSQPDGDEIATNRVFIPIKD